MIYGYTLTAPQLGNHTLLVCKNIDFSDHHKIWWDWIWKSGGGYSVKKDFGHHGNEYIKLFDSKDNLHQQSLSVHKTTLQNYFIQYGANHIVIDRIICNFRIQMLARFNQHSLKQDELSVIEQINLAVKLEADPYCHSEGK